MLNDRQQLFVAEYLKDFKPMAAAERAGYSTPPWSDEVRAAVDEGVRNRREVLEIDGALVLREVATIAFASMGDYFDPNWEIKDISDLTDLQKRAIETVQIEEDDDGIKRVKIKLHSKLQANELLGKNLKLFTERMEISAVEGLAERLAEARQRSGLTNNELIGLLALLCSTIVGLAQTAILLPDPHPQFFDVNGNPLVGGKVFTFLAGTAIQEQTYTDSTATTLNSNPVILDSGGYPSCAGSSCGIYLVNGISYRIVVQNSLGIQQWVADNVKLVNSAQVGGANTQVQYNCAGAFCGSPNFTWNNGSQTLTVTSLVVTAGGTLSGSFGGNPVFTGTVTFSGTVNFTAITANSLTSTCANPASAGFVRMCKTDAVNWRNSTNTGDYGITTSNDANELQVISAPGGLELTGATGPSLKLGGLTNAFPMLARNGTTVQVKLADNSALANLTANALTYDASGVTISGACSTAQVLTATSATAVSCQAPPAGEQFNYHEYRYGRWRSRQDLGYESRNNARDWLPV